ncbi:MAG: DUF1674 domain-containing protein [Pseudomonadota bacterium]
MSDQERTDSQGQPTEIPKNRPENPPPANANSDAAPDATAADEAEGKPREIGGFDGPEPTRFGDWEHNGRCTDF